MAVDREFVYISFCVYIFCDSLVSLELICVTLELIHFVLLGTNLGFLLEAFGAPWAPKGSPWCHFGFLLVHLGCRWAPFGHPWAPKGSLG